MPIHVLKKGLVCCDCQREALYTESTDDIRLKRILSRAYCSQKRTIIYLQLILYFTILPIYKV